MGKSPVSVEVQAKQELLLAIPEQDGQRSPSQHRHRCPHNDPPASTGTAARTGAGRFKPFSTVLSV